MIGIVKVARSDWGHTRGLYEALGEQARTLDYLCSSMEGLSAVVILGDRWEMAHAAVRAVHARVPIVHLHGGEWTPNAIDNRYRNAISQMASVHCVAHPVHRDRLIRMGIDPATIHVTGAPGLDRYQVPPMSREMTAHALGLDPKRRWAIVMLHPTTLRPQDADDEWNQTLEAVGTYEPVWFSPGHDPGADKIRSWIIAYGLTPVEEVTESEWVSLMHHAEVVIGNTSAIVIDCPFLKKRTIEIGRRQEGRDRVPYGDGNSIPRILEVLHESAL